MGGIWETMGAMESAGSRDGEWAVGWVAGIARMIRSKNGTKSEELVSSLSPYISIQYSSLWDLKSKCQYWMIWSDVCKMAAPSLNNQNWMCGDPLYRGITRTIYVGRKTGPPEHQHLPTPSWNGHSNVFKYFTKQPWVLQILKYGVVLLKRGVGLKLDYIL